MQQPRSQRRAQLLRRRLDGEGGGDDDGEEYEAML